MRTLFFHLFTLLYEKKINSTRCTTSLMILINLSELLQHAAGPPLLGSTGLYSLIPANLLITSLRGKHPRSL